mmetsp:Transcript_39120/g.102562  ORF Transcript_39120/g.102562 Transcript_39120/m.102562 type:complete len:206 (+) Transcript_39120:665-1282(+)
MRVRLPWSARETTAFGGCLVMLTAFSLCRSPRRSYVSRRRPPWEAAGATARQKPPNGAPGWFTRCRSRRCSSTQTGSLERLLRHRLLRNSRAAGPPRARAVKLSRLGSCGRCRGLPPRCQLVWGCTVEMQPEVPPFRQAGRRELTALLCQSGGAMPPIRSTALTALGPPTWERKPPCIEEVGLQCRSSPVRVLWRIHSARRCLGR